jgi:hypothetical protein
MENGATLNTLADSGAGTVSFDTSATTNTATITAATEDPTGAAVTVVTSAAHNFKVGDSVTITGVTPAAYNGTYAITGVTPTSFTYTNPTAGVAAAERRQ